MHTSISDYDNEYPIINNSFKENNFSEENWYMSLKINSTHIILSNRGKYAWLYTFNKNTRKNR